MCCLIDPECVLFSSTSKSKYHRPVKYTQGADDERSLASKTEDEIVKQGKIIIDLTDPGYGGRYDPETNFPTDEMNTPDWVNERKSAPGVSGKEYLAIKTGVIPTPRSKVALSRFMKSLNKNQKNTLRAFDPGSGGARKFAQRIISQVKNLDVRFSKGEKASEVKRNALEKLAGDIALKVESAFDMPFDDARAVVDDVVGTRLNRKGEVIKLKIPEPTTDPVAAAKAAADDIYNKIELAENSPKPATKFLYRALNKMLTDVAGKNYKKNPDVGKALYEYFIYEFPKERNQSGREITQPKDVAKYRETGEFSAEQIAYQKRKKDLDENAVGDSAPSQNEIEQLKKLEHQQRAVIS